MRGHDTEVNRMAIGPRASSPADPDAPVRSGNVFYDDRLSKGAPHHFGPNSPAHISAAARSVRNDHGDGPCRISLRACNPRYSWERNSARCQMEKLTART